VYVRVLCLRTRYSQKLVALVDPMKSEKTGRWFHGELERRRKGALQTNSLDSEGRHDNRLCVTLSLRARYFRSLLRCDLGILAR